MRFELPRFPHCIREKVLNFSFQRKQFFFYRQSTAEAGEAAIAPHHSVAGDEDHDRVAVTSHARRPGPFGASGQGRHLSVA